MSSFNDLRQNELQLEEFGEYIAWGYVMWTSFTFSRHTPCPSIMRSLH